MAYMTLDPFRSSSSLPSHRSKGRGTSVLDHVIQEAVYNSIINEATDILQEIFKNFTFDCSVVCISSYAINDTVDASYEKFRNFGVQSFGCFHFKSVLYSADMVTMTSLKRGLHTCHTQPLTLNSTTQGLRKIAVETVS